MCLYAPEINQFVLMYLEIRLCGHILRKWLESQKIKYNRIFHGSEMNFSNDR